MSDHLSFARQVLRIEGEAILRLEARLGDEINRAVSLIVACSGRVVVTGMGKAGLVGRKISATLASTGVPSFFLHPAEAAHGDLGQVVDGDLILALSNSGRTAELLRLLPELDRLSLPLIAITAAHDSPLEPARRSVLSSGAPTKPVRSACANHPSTVMLALGDALAMAAAEAKGTSREDFACAPRGATWGAA